jgi:hypothetical protein
LAYEWNNLNLSCDNCNNKLNHKDISIHDALNPCINSDIEIQEHLTYEKELIEAKNNSPIGLKTIQKYRLDKEILDSRRLKQLSYFQDTLIEIQQRRINDGGRELSKDEKDLIYSFARKDKPYSLMFKLLLEKNGF